MTRSSRLLREKGVRVHYFAQLLAEVLETDEGRVFVLDRTVHGRAARADARRPVAQASWRTSTARASPAT